MALGVERAMSEDFGFPTGNLDSFGWSAPRYRRGYWAGDCRISSIQEDILQGD